MSSGLRLNLERRLAQAGLASRSQFGTLQRRQEDPIELGDGRAPPPWQLFVFRRLTTLILPVRRYARKMAVGELIIQSHRFFPDAMRVPLTFQSAFGGNDAPFGRTGSGSGIEIDEVGMS